MYLSSCKPLVYQTYTPYRVSKTITIPHEQVMSEYRTRKQVFLDFGVPDNQSTYDSITAVTYNLGTVTSSSAIGSALSFNSGSAESKSVYTGVYMSSYNPFYDPNAIRTIYNSMSVTSVASMGYSQTSNRYAKFWMIGDSVMKWETLGLNKSRIEANRNYDESLAQAAAAEQRRVNQENTHMAMERLARIAGVATAALVVIILATVI